MRKIKFRGADMNGKYVYGLLTKKRVRNSRRLSWAIATGNFTAGDTIPVSEESVSQLIGEDKNGNEIYEGDEVTIGDRKVTATFEYFSAIRTGEIIKCAK